MTAPKLRNDCFALPPGVDWTPVDEALSRLRQAVHPVTGTETRPVATAGGRVLAADAIAARANPPYANSAVDGYGFAFSSLSADDNHDLPLSPGRAAAGVPFTGKVPAGESIRILTGAMLPEGVDTVVLEEDVEATASRITFQAGLKPGANTRKAGEDVEAGAVALKSGHKLRPQDLALLTALGLDTVALRKPLKVAVLSTGDEIIEPGQQAAPHQIYDANRPMLLDLIRRWGMEPIDLGRAADTREAVRTALDKGAEADAILTSGGASAGDEDHMSAILKAEGHVQNWRIAVKPGRPLALGTWKGTPVFGLPGNPVAAFVCTLIFARPALRVLAGEDWHTPTAYTLPAAFSKSKKPGRREYLRARLTPEGHAEVFKSEGSGRISGLSWATGLIELPDEAAEITPGTPVRYLPYSEFGL